MDNYAKLVKQMHWPKVSPKKRNEMKKLKQSIEMRNRTLKSGISARNLASTDIENKKMRRSRHTKSQVKINWRKFHNPMVPKEKPKKTGVVIDYLLQKRIKREEKDINLYEDENVTLKNPAEDWKSLLDKALDNKDFQGLMKQKARVIENNAEMTRKTAIHTDDIDGEDKANDMLIDALQAKLSILDKI